MKMVAKLVAVFAVVAVLTACGTTPSSIAVPIVDDGPYVNLPANAAEAAKAASSAAAAAQRAAQAAADAVDGKDAEAKKAAARRATEAARDAAGAASAAASAASQAQSGMNPINPHEQRYKMSADPNARSIGTAGGRILPTERTYGGVLAQIDGHIRVWNNQAEETQNWSEKLSNTAFAGAVLGGLGVIANALDVGKAGALIGGSAGIWNNQYKWATQAENYRRARDAMDCMRTAVARIPEPVWKENFDAAGYPTVTKQAYLGVLEGDERKAAADAYNNLATVFDHIHGSVQQVRNRLEDKQRQVIAAAPKPEEIAAALKAQDRQEKQSNDTTRRIMLARAPFVESPARSPEAVEALIPADRAREQILARRTREAVSRGVLGASSVQLNTVVTAEEIRAEQLAVVRRMQQERKDRILNLAGATEQQFLAATDPMKLQQREELMNLNSALDACVAKVGS